MDNQLIGRWKLEDRRGYTQVDQGQCSGFGAGDMLKICIVSRRWERRREGGRMRTKPWP